jgi:hypothetical protein
VASIEPVPGSITALHEMHSLKLDVRLLIDISSSFNTSSLEYKLKWIEKRLSKDWRDRVIIGRFLILSLYSFPLLKMNLLDQC